jgi:hypothetical protein
VISGSTRALTGFAGQLFFKVRSSRALLAGPSHWAPTLIKMWMGWSPAQFGALGDGGWNCEVENGSVRSFATTLNVLERLLAHERATGGYAESIAAPRRVTSTS